MKKELVEIIKKAVLSLDLGLDLNFNDIQVEYTKDEKFGDYSTNIAMVLAKKLKRNPLEIAQKIQKKIQDKSLEKVKVAKPGYINFYLSLSYLQDKINEINKLKEKFGDNFEGKGIKVNNEFISANPTGPLHLGNGRGGFYGDALSKVLKKCGYEVISEYYINDGGKQIEQLGHSVIKDSQAVYAGNYIDELNKKYGQLDIQEAGTKAVEYILEKIIKKTIEEKMKISFDSWISERKEIIDSKLSQKAIEILRSKNVTYEKDGAIWLATSKFGDDKDRVLVKSNGKNAYLASDCGYFLHKMERKFQKLIIILGADHHGYIPRMKAAARMLGFQGELKFIIVQLVRLIKNGQETRMSKRAGNVVYIDELISEVGHDAARGNVESRNAMPLFRLLCGRSVASSLLGDDMDDDGPVGVARDVERVNKGREAVAVHGTDVSQAHFLEERASQEKALDRLLDAVVCKAQPTQPEFPAESFHRPLEFVEPRAGQQRGEMP